MCICRKRFKHKKEGVVAEQTDDGMYKIPYKGDYAYIPKEFVENSIEWENLSLPSNEEDLFSVDFLRKAMQPLIDEIKICYNTIDDLKQKLPVSKVDDNKPIFSKKDVLEAIYDSYVGRYGYRSAGVTVFEIKKRLGLL